MSAIPCAAVRERRTAGSGGARHRGPSAIGGWIVRVHVLAARCGCRAALLGAALLAPGGHAGAQTHWWVPGLVGGGGLGVLIGVPAAFAGDSYDDALWPMATGAAGAIAGTIVGRRADARLGRGEPLSGLHRTTLRVATVLTGTTVGALGAAAVITAGSGNAEGQDEKVFAGCVIGGTILGVVLDHRLAPSLAPRPSVAVWRARGATRVAIGVAF